MLTLPQFHMTNFLSTSLFVWIFMFLTYKFLQNTIIKYINNLTSYSENKIQELENENNKTEIEINESHKKIKKIQENISIDYKNAKDSIQKNIFQY